MRSRVWIIAGVLLFLSVATLSSEARAAASSQTMQNALTFCKTQRTSDPSGIIQPLIECFTNTNSGIIPTATNTLMTAMDSYYLAPLTDMCILLVALVGISIITGFSTMQIKSELFVAAFKIGGVLYFLHNIHSGDDYYGHMIGIIQELSDNIANAATATIGQNNTPSGFCVTATSGSGTGAGSGPGDALWNDVDCIIGYLFGFNGATGFSGSSGGVGVLTLGICSFLLMMFISKGSGGLIFTVGAYVLFKLVSLTVKFIQTYIMCILNLSFIFWFGYLFVPLLLFRQTFNYFQRWLSFCLLFILQPVLVLGFLAISLVIMDDVFFAGKYSVLQAVAGTSATSGGTTASNVFTTTANTKSNMAHCYINLFITTYSGSTQGGTSAGGVPTQNCNSNFQEPAGTTINGTNLTQMNGGIQGTITDLHQPGSVLMLLQSGGNIDNVGFDFNFNDPDHPNNIGGLNLTTLATAAGQTSGTDPVGTYVANIAFALVTAALVMYILSAIADKIEDIAGELVGGGLSVGHSGASGKQLFSDMTAQRAAAAAGGGAKNLIPDQPSGGGGGT